MICPLVRVYLLAILLSSAAGADEFSVYAVTPTLSGPMVPQSITGSLPEKIEFSFSQRQDPLSLAPAEDFRAEPTHHEAYHVRKQRLLLENMPDREKVIDFFNVPANQQLKLDFSFLIAAF